MAFRLRYWLIGGAVLTTVAAVLLLRDQGAESAAPATVAVNRGEVTSSVAASGTVQPLAKRELAFSTTGTVTLISVKPGDVVTAGQKLAAIDNAEAKESVATAQSTLDAARKTLETATNIYSAELAVTKAEQALTKAKNLLAGTTLVAPIAGKVLSVGGKAGDTATTATFITLGVMENMMVRAEFAEADAISLAVGQKAVVQLANQTGTSYPVTIAEVASAGTVSDRLVRYTVWLTFDSPPADLLIGQSATAQVVVARAENVLLLPQSAVSGKQIKLPDGTSKAVEIGLRGDGNVEIKSGLADGELVRLNAR
ncbi:MAG TPA: hypothetical protein DGT23_23295 [Micromonosporaceae bacterium]|nr:hypothetical protein [Micromonosporaceae bacterium]